MPQCGTVRVIGEGFGFIHCPFKGADVWAHHTELKGFKVGQDVTFDLHEHNGKMQAKNLKVDGPVQAKHEAPSKSYNLSFDELWEELQTFVDDKIPLYPEVSKQLKVTKGDVELVRAVMADELALMESFQRLFARVFDVNSMPKLSWFEQKAGEFLQRMEKFSAAAAVPRGSKKHNPYEGAGVRSRIWSSGSANEFDQGDGAKAQYWGNIVSFSNNGGHGWIHCPQLVSGEHSGKVYLPKEEFSGFRIGDDVNFKLLETDKGPRAYDVTDSELHLDEEYEGTVKAFFADRGFGWIHCPRLMNSTLCATGDVYLPESEKNGFDIGRCIRFKLRAHAKGLHAFELTPVVHEGVIKSFNSDKGYGWISCSLLASPENPSDVYLHSNYKGKFNVGDAVSFEIRVVSKGSGMQAMNLKEPGAAAEAPAENVLYDGIIKSFDAERGVGFITCPSVMSGDVFLHSSDISTFSVGDRVSFCIVTNRGKPQAKALRSFEGDDAHGAANGGAAEKDEDGATDNEETFHGIIHCFKKDKGFGFITCPQNPDGDVFLHQSELNDFNVGEYVSFKIRNRKGKQQATQLRAYEPDEGFEAPGVTTSDAKDLHTYHGYIKVVHPDKGFGFISSKDARAAFNQDVFVHEKHLKKMGPGDYVSFTIKIDPKTRPRARNLKKCEPPAEEDEDDMEVDPRSYTGIIKSFVTDETERGYGFISSAEVHEKYTRDAFLHHKQIKDFKQGDRVVFSLRINEQGQPQAFNLKEAPSTVAWLSAGIEEKSAKPQDVIDKDDTEEYLGEIKSFNAAKGFGFIKCDAVFEKYEKDVYLAKQQCENMSPGDTVSFRIQVKLGHPQAIDVVCVKKAPKADASGDYSSLSGDELDKKLLRACASAKITAADEMEKLVKAGANPNIRDVTGQTTLMIAALQVRYSEKKCRLLISYSADIHAKSSNDPNAQTVLQWARERINGKFAAFLESTARGDDADVQISYDNAGENDF